MNKNVTYQSQVKVDVSSDGMKTVTGHVILTRGIFHNIIGLGKDGGMGDIPFCLECHNAPQGLPLKDETSPIGSPFPIDFLST